MSGNHTTNVNFQGKGVSISGPAQVTIRDIYIDSDHNRDSDLLADLAVTDPRGDKARIEQLKGGLLAECFQWVLRHPDFQQWRGGTGIRQLWIKGDPGKGKTMLMCGIINELKASCSNTHNICYFFCQTTNSMLNTATAALRGLLYLLLDQQRPLVVYLRALYETRRKELFQDINAWYALHDVFLEILQDPSLRETFIIVDALDECNDGLQRLLDLIEEISGHDRVKVLVSSRNWPSIERKLKLAPQKTRLSLELNHEAISAAVRIYIEIKTDQLFQDLDCDEETRRDAHDYLVANADSTFLWVALVCQELADNDDVESWEIGEFLRQFPPGLFPLYRRMAEQIFASRHFGLCRPVIAAACSVHRPVSLSELAHLIESSDKATGKLDKIVGYCHSFLTLKEQVIYFVHQSAKEYLLKEESSRIIPSGLDYQHQILFSNSLKVLNSTLRRNMYNLRISGTLVSQIEKPKADPLKAIYYSCVFWVDHLCEARLSETAPDSTSLRDGGTAHEFLKQHFLYWLEALGLMGKIPEGILALRALEKLTAAQGSKAETKRLVHDALRFILSHKASIELAPLQVYSSAIVFSPTSSLVRQRFESQECPKWITSKPIMEGKWSPCLQTLQGHMQEIKHVLFLPSKDTQVVSCSLDRTIKIWDLSTGACLRTIECQDHFIESLVALPDSSRLVSGSRHPTVKIWKTATGECLQTLEAHTKVVKSLAALPDGTLFASGSNDNSIRCCKSTTGECLRTMSLPDPVEAVAFSPDGTQLASGSRMTGIQIWDVAIGKLLYTIDGSRGVTSITFSPDGTWLASASFFTRIVQIWDMTTRKCIHRFKERTHITHLEISPNGQRAAYLLDNGTIRIWHDQHLHTLARRGKKPTSMAFSPGSAWLSLGLEDGNIQIWDANADTSAQDADSHEVPVHSVVVSSNGARIASASRDNTIKMWDAATGTCLFTLINDWKRARSMTFSPDGSWIALPSAGERGIDLWGTLTGVKIGTFERSVESVQYLAFSPDGAQLASASGRYEHALEIWDTITFTRLRTMKIEKTSGTALLAFSPDSSKLVSGDLQPVVSIWDPATGALLHSLSLDPGVLSLDPANRVQLHTRFGDFDVQFHMHENWFRCFKPIHGQDNSSLRLSPDKTWVMKRQERVLWLPPEYRPSCIGQTETTLGMGYSTGGVLCLQFSQDEMGVESS